MAFTSPEELMKNLPKAMGNITGMMGGGGFGDSLTFKLSMRVWRNGPKSRWQGINRN